MDMDRSSAECLLQDELDEEKSQSRFGPPTKRHSKSPYLVKALVLSIVVLLGTNAFFLFQHRSLVMTDHKLARSKYGKFRFQSTKLYHRIEK